MKLKKIKIKDINIEVAPSNEMQQASLIETTQNENPIQLRLNGNGKYDIIDGRRRVVDLIAIGKDTVWAIIKEVSDAELAMQAIILNSGTANYMDEADHIYTLIQKHGMSIEAIAKKGNVTTQTIYDRLRLKEKLIPEIQEHLRAGTIKYSVALELTHLPISKQAEASTILDSGEKLKLKDVKEVKRLYQAENTYESLQIPLIPEEQGPTFSPGLFLDSEQVKVLLAGQSLEVEYQGRNLTLKVL